MNERVKGLILSHIQLILHGITVPPGHQVHHKDGDHFNNDVDNLQVVTLAEHNHIHHLGQKFTQEQRERMSKSHQGYRPTKETKKKLSKIATGKTFSAEHREKLAAAQLGRRHSKETIEKIAKASAGSKRSPEVRKRMSEAQRRRFTNECNKS